MIKQKNKVVLMKREQSTNPPPYTATVDPTEVKNWEKYGWEVVKLKEKKK